MDQRGDRGGRTWAVIPADLETLPELLERAGYATYGLTANFSLPAERGFGRGFRRYRCLGAVGAEDVRPVLEAWLPDIRSERPWFLWIHLFDPHAPYLARERWLPALRPGATRRYPELDGMPANDLHRAEPGLDKDRLEYVRSLYDSEIREDDELLRWLFEALPGAADALVVFTADHGEEFLEHGDSGHGRTLFEESVRIPLILKLPGNRFGGTVVQAPASLVDVLPTVLGAAGVAAPGDRDGVDLLGSGEPGAAVTRKLYADLKSGRHLRAVIDGEWKLIQDVNARQRTALFDLGTDPEERRNLAAASPERVAGLGRDVEARFGREDAGERAARTRTAITPAQKRALRALGYTD
jgi:choline-sulfatase